MTNLSETEMRETDMPVMNFDLEDGKPKISFVLKPDDAERFAAFMAECSEYKRQVAELEADARRLSFMFSNQKTTSNALVVLELRLLNGDTPTINEARAAIDDAMAAALNTETTE